LAPRLYLPLDGSETPDSVIAFRWSTCWHESLDSYRLELSTDSTFVVVDQTFSGLTDNDYTPVASLPAGRYHWRVKASRAAGDSTDYSETYSFVSRCQAGAPPVLSWPAASDTLESTTVDLEWELVGDAGSYRLQLSTLPDFSLLQLDTTLLLPQLTVTGLADSTAYFWRVNSTNGCGTGAWNESRFSVLLCPITLTGDVNVNGSLTSADIIWLVGYIFKSGAAPLPVAEAGDVNCDSVVNSGDIIYLVNHIFKGGPAPCDACSVL
jgi:hypothetical protein